MTDTAHAARGRERRLGIGDWIAATRPRTLVATLVPVMVGLALAWRDGGVAAGLAVLTLAMGLLVQIATNLANDYFDGRLSISPTSQFAQSACIAFIRSPYSSAARP